MSAINASIVAGSTGQELRRGQRSAGTVDRTGVEQERFGAEIRRRAPSSQASRAASSVSAEGDCAERAKRVLEHEGAAACADA